MALAIAYTCPCGAAYVAVQHQVGLPQPCLLCGRVLDVPPAPGLRPRVLEVESASSIGSPFRLLKRRRSRSPLWPWLGFAACLAVLAGLGIQLLTKPTKGALVSP